MNNATTISYCKACPRINSHLHYSNIHDLFVKLGLITVILAEAVAFASGFVQSWTHHYFDYGTIASYNRVADTIDGLIAPYQSVSNIAYILDVVSLALAIVAAVTLHSISKRKLHRVTLSFAFGLSLLKIVTVYYYNSLTAQALEALPSLVDSATLSTYRRVDLEFQAAYGFWGGSAHFLVGILILLSAAALGAASLTTKVVLVWNRTEPSQQEALTIEPKSHTMIQCNESKYCRYCGARLPDISKYCEECGKNLVG